MRETAFFARRQTIYIEDHLVHLWFFFFFPPCLQCRSMHFAICSIPFKPHPISRGQVVEADGQLRLDAAVDGANCRCEAAELMTEGLLHGDKD